MTDFINSPIVSDSPSKPRLLFVVSDDFGELDYAINIIEDFESTDSMTLLLPERLYALNSEIVPNRTFLYRSLEDILARAEIEKPHVAFLFCAYLYSCNGIMSDESLAALIKYLKKNRCPIVTSDLFLGFFSNPHAWPRYKNPLEYLRRIESFRAMKNLYSGIYQMVKDLYHYYPVAPQGVVGVAPRNRIACFNKALLQSTPHDQTAEAVIPDTSGVAPFQKWLFVLGEVDFRQLKQKFTEKKFLNQISKKLNETVAMRKTPIFVGPEPCIAQLRQQTHPSVILSPQNRRQPFTQWLRQSEYVFYWNAVSHSHFYRLINAQPVFFFDGGHLINDLGLEFFGLVKNIYWQGWQPDFLDFRKSLNENNLKRLAQRQTKKLRSLREVLKSLPQPRQMVQTLLMDKNTPPRDRGIAIAVGEAG